MTSHKENTFHSLSENVGKFHLRDKTFLIPEMNRIGCHLFAASFRGFGIQAKVMDTCKGLDLGNEYTSGKECYPCQITVGDVLYFLMKEKEKLGEAFNASDYVYFMPESDGPCRFGMYNKYQRIVLDSFPEFKKVKIGSLTAEDAYSLKGIIEQERVTDLRKALYFSVVVADILDRLLWRIRPYEREQGLADCFIENSMRLMEKAFENHAGENEFDRILDKLEELIQEGKNIIDAAVPRKPRIGVVGEIYVRTHVHANKDVIRLLEKHGAEVVNASIAEWMNYISYDGLREAKKEFRMKLKQMRWRQFKPFLQRIISFGGDLIYKELKQKEVYSRLGAIIDLAGDHKVAHLEDILKEEDIFTFDVRTESCLSIAAIMNYARDGFDGVVNVYPFTCMPGTTTAAIVKPLMNHFGIPFLDLPYDSSSQPGNEAAIRTFMYQASQHFSRQRRRGSQKSPRG